MKINPIASSSAGNCTAIESNGQILLIDCGISVARIRAAIGGFDKVVGCLITHEHGDHAGFVEQLMAETSVQVFGKNYPFGFCIAGDFRIKPVPLFHDVECYGFLIMTKTEKLFYATDTSSIPYTFPGLTRCAIEANFDWKLIAESDMNDFVTQRTINNHLDLESAIQFAERHHDLEELHLLHLSDAHSNAKTFKEESEARLGIPVFIAPK